MQPWFKLVRMEKEFGYGMYVLTGLDVGNGQPRVTANPSMTMGGPAAAAQMTAAMQNPNAMGNSPFATDRKCYPCLSCIKSINTSFYYSCNNEHDDATDDQQRSITTQYDSSTTGMCENIPCAFL